jgi:vancomycin resistance protein YoaR
VGRRQLAKSSAELPPVSAKPQSRRREWRGPEYFNRIIKWLQWDRRESILAFSTLGVALFAILVGLSLYGFSHGARIYEGVQVAGIDIGGMTKAEARSALQAPLADSNSTPLTLQSGSDTYTIVPADSGLRFDLDATVDRAYDVGRTESVARRVFVWSNALLHGRDVAPVYTIDDATLNAALANIAGKVIVAPQDAYVSMNAEGGPTIVQEQNGQAFDLSSTRAALVDQFAQLTREPVTMVLPVLSPTVSSAQLEMGAESARSAVAGTFTIDGPENQTWSLNPSDLQGVLSVSQQTGKLDVDQAAIQRLVEGLASSIERDAQDANIYVDDNDQIVVQAGVSSIGVDRDGSAQAIADAMLNGGSKVDLVTTSKPPVIQDDQASAAAAEAEALVANGLPLTWTGGDGELTRQELLAALTINVDPNADVPFAFGFDQSVLGAVMQPLFDEIAVDAKNPQMRLVDGKITVESKAVDGVAVDAERTVEAVANAAINKSGSTEVFTEVAKPQYGSVKTSDIELPDTLASSSTYYGESSDARRKNVEQAAKLENGWLVAPGDTFSFVEHVGGVSEKEGFVVGFGIVDNGEGGVTTAPVIGGGVCQMSTTIFQAAFWSGLPIVERYTHPYWINTYGQPPTGFLGLDAMINVEKDYSLDFKFTNSTDNWIAVVTEADGENLTAKILGTNPGWTIDVSDPVISDIQTPSDEMIYEDSPELPAGQELQVEHAAQGFTSTFQRTVKDGDTVVSEDTFTGTYAPSNNTTLRGTGS